MATAVLVAITTMVLVVEFRRQADSSRDELQLLLRVSGGVNSLNALEWQAIAEGEVTRELLEKTEQAQTTVEAGLVAIAGHDKLGSDEAALLDDYRAYAAAVDQELALVADGRIEAALALDEQTVDPRYAALRAAIDDQVIRHEGQARAGARNSDIGVAVIIVLATLVIGALLWSQEALRRGAHRAAAASVARRAFAGIGAANRANDLSNHSRNQQPRHHHPARRTKRAPSPQRRPRRLRAGSRPNCHARLSRGPRSKRQSPQGVSRRELIE